MRCWYIGKSEEHPMREAYVEYEGYEEEKFNRIVEIMDNKGWKFYCEEECATVLVFDRDEYTEDFLPDWKAAKKEVGAR